MYHRIHKYFIQILLIVCLNNASFIFANDSTKNILIISKPGFLDLRNQNFDNSPIPLHVNWAFYWKKLLLPTSPDSAFVKPQFFPYSTLWNELHEHYNEITAQGYATYTLKVLMPHQNKPLAIAVPDVYSCYRIFINGKELISNGNPDSIPEKAIPKWMNRTIEMNDPSDTLSILIQVANFWHSKGGPYKDIIIGKKATLFYEKEKNIAFDLLLTGCLFMGGLFFFGLFLFGQHDKVILYFSLFCILYSYRIIGTGYYELHTIFPLLPWTITTHLEYLTLFGSVGCFALYTRSLYPKDFHKIAAILMILLCGSFILITLIFPPVIFTRLINPFLVTMFFFIAYTFFVYIKAAKCKRIGANYSLLSTAVGLIISIIINLEYFKFLDPQKGILFIGYLIFFFLQSLILSFRFAYTLKQANSLAEEGLKVKSEFLSTMSHEIRTPLNSVIGLSHILLNSNPRDDQKNHLKVLLFSASNLLTIVNDILDFNKIEGGEIKFEQVEMDMHEIANNIIIGLSAFAKEKNLSLSLEIDPLLHSKLIGDPKRTSQIITNLVHNAVKFTKQGSVILAISEQSRTEYNVTLRVSVKDTGIGIDDQKLKVVFERFTQADSSASRKFGGTGLGLTISKNLLALQGCELKVNSIAGKGSEFYFQQTFPLLKSESALNLNPSKIPEEESMALSGMKILLVEDNEMNIMVAQTILERWGAIVDVARNGEEALQQLDIKEHVLVLMDMHMPIMDGYTATRKMRESGVSIPIIALTASLPKEIEAHNNPGITDIVVKPFLPSELYRKILHYTNIYPISNFSE